MVTLKTSLSNDTENNYNFMIYKNDTNALFRHDYTTEIAKKPWANAGYLRYCVDIQHPNGEARGRNITKIGTDIFGMKDTNIK